MTQHGDIVIGLDVGGTTVKGAAVDDSGTLHHRATWPSAERMGTNERVLDALANCIRELSQPQAPTGVGIGIPGIVDAASGTVAESPNFPDWENVPVVDGLRRRGIELPIWIDNDANAACVAEAHFGAAQDVRTFLMLTLGTGVGGGVYLDGNLWRGHRGMAGELGHILVQPHGRRCGCGARGCLEQYASLTGLKKAVLEYAMEIDDAEALAERPDLPERLAELANNGNQAAMACFQQLGFFLGLGIASLLNALNPERVVLGGGMAQALPLFQHTLAETIGEQAFERAFRGVQIVQSALGTESGILGAAALARGTAP